MQQDCSQNKNSTPEAEYVAGRAGRQERCLHLHHKTHGGRGGKELRVADPRPAHPGQARHLRPVCRGGAVEPERILRVGQQSKQAQAQAGIQRLHKRE